MAPSLSNPFLPRELAAIDALLTVAEAPSAHPRERRLAATKVLDICERLRADPAASEVAPGFRPASAATAEPPNHLPLAPAPTQTEPAAVSPSLPAASPQPPRPQAPAPIPASRCSTQPSHTQPSGLAAASPIPHPDRTRTQDPYFTALDTTPLNTPALPAAAITAAARRPTPELPRAA